jgi:hypothetical protein
MSVDHSAILMARNRTKRRYQDFRYEAMQGLMQSVTGSASEFAFAVCAMALKAMGKQMNFLTEQDMRLINDLRSRIAASK